MTRAQARKRLDRLAELEDQAKKDYLNNPCSRNYNKIMALKAEWQKVHIVYCNANK